MKDVSRRPDLYAEVVVCSPFIDETMQRLLVRIARVTHAAQCGLRIITTSPTASALRERLPGHPAAWGHVVLGRQGLHAKVYLALSRQRALSEVIVTSANFTTAGIDENIELGIRARPSTDYGRQLMDEVRHFLRAIATPVLGDRSAVSRLHTRAR
jgi:hypothetical protein